MTLLANRKNSRSTRTRESLSTISRRVAPNTLTVRQARPKHARAVLRER